MGKTHRHVALFYKPRRKCARCGSRDNHGAGDMWTCTRCGLSWPKLTENKKVKS